MSSNPASFPDGGEVSQPGLDSREPSGKLVHLRGRGEIARACSKCPLSVQWLWTLVTPPLLCLDFLQLTRQMPSLSTYPISTSDLAYLLVISGGFITHLKFNVFS